MRGKDYNKVIFSTFIRFFIVIIILICCGWLVYSTTREITREQLLLICAKMLQPAWFLFSPEHKERITFITLTLLSVPLCIEVIFISERFSNAKKWLDENLKPSGIIALNIFVLILTAACLYQRGLHPQFMYILFKPVWMNSYFLLLPVLALTAFMVYAAFKWKLNKWNYGMLILLLFIPLLQVLSCRLFSSLKLVSKSVPEHSNIIAYGVSQAAAGCTDYHQYGFYARMLAPVFRIIPPDMLNISIVMAVLFITGCLSVYWVLSRNVKNQALVFAFAFIFFLTSGIWGFLHVSQSSLFIDPYFAYYPIRFICPALAVLCFYLQARFRKKYFIFICGILGGISLWWNLDSGIAVAGAFAAYMFLELVFSRTRSAAIQFLSFLVSGILTFLGLMLVFSIQQGGMVSQEEAFKYIKFFSCAGFMMIPMPGLPSPWCVFIGIYLMAIIIGLRDFIAGRFSISAKMSLFLAILGIGLFTYYQGRSHIYNLPVVIWPALLLLFIYADQIIRLVRNGMVNKYFKLLLVPAFFMSACAVVTVAAGGNMLVSGVERTCRNLINTEKPSQLRQDVKFILANAKDHKTVNIVSDMQGIYYAETGLKAGIDNFNMVEIFFVDDWKRVVNEIHKADAPLLIARYTRCKQQRIAPWVYENYILKAVNKNGSLYYFVPKPEK